MTPAHIMVNAQWFLLGGLLLPRGPTISLLKNLPVTPAIVYLGVTSRHCRKGAHPPSSDQL